LKIYRGYLKRLLDVLMAGISLVLLSPLMLLTSVAIRLDDGGPTLFRQKRVGRKGKIFEVLKFRSLPVNTGDFPSSQAGELRTTRVGRVIRRTNIDELPQLVNILRGDMSLVGPRPALPTQAQLVAMREEVGALECKPGLTGLAQVNAYDGMPDTEKVDWDGKYAARVSFMKDLMIVLKTFSYLTRRPPVY
jgi:O-antigen biosynthesis protein WbqP